MKHFRKPYQRRFFQCTNQHCLCLDEIGRGGTRMSAGKDKAQCSGCVTGKWHHIFPKATPEQWRLAPAKDGFFYQPANHPTPKETT